MKKYIIRDRIRECGNVENREKMNKDEIKIHRFTFLRAYVSEDIFFSECRNMVEKIREDDLRYQYSEADTEKIMYQTLLASIYNDELIWLDICFHLYYTLLYEKNKNSYTVLVEGRKEKECQRCRIKEGVETCDKCGKSKKCPKRKAASEYAEEFKKRGKRLIVIKNTGKKHCKGKTI